MEWIAVIAVFLYMVLLAYCWETRSDLKGLYRDLARMAAESKNSRMIAVERNQLLEKMVEIAARERVGEGTAKDLPHYVDLVVTQWEIKAREDLWAQYIDPMEHETEGG